VSQVATHLDEEGARRLRACIEAEQAAGAAGIAAGSSHNLHVLLAEMTGNVALRLFIETLAQLTFERTHSLDYDRQEVSETHAAHQAIVDAVIAGDAPLAQHRLRAHLAAALTYYQRREEPGADSPSSNEGTQKL
jgi:DNA-binding GntR family transcriptional regulator